MCARKLTAERCRTWLLVALFVAAPKVLYATALGVVSFLPFSAGTKMGLAGVLIVAAEVVFFVLAFFLGKEVLSRYRGYLDPRRWFVKR